MNLNQKARLCFDTQNFNNGERVKACVKFEDSRKFENKSTQLIFSGIVDESGLAISDEVCENN